MFPEKLDEIQLQVEATRSENVRLRGLPRRFLLRKFNEMKTPTENQIKSSGVRSFRCSSTPLCIEVDRTSANWNERFGTERRVLIKWV
ncbi:hypothetical protein AVEN_242706-1 [Araneus ventricosus]|uniref:Uncharacterized protein n=1 Tax=Araneus ventricosus TaxID=182803 RepID=A0A4Y2E1X6_ARAVE|nr:hypothetical protein AVEN_242706-1 [Araneus ventricosus]